MNLDIRLLKTIAADDGKMNSDILILCATEFEISYFLNLCPGNIIKKTRGQTIISGNIPKKKYNQDKKYNLVITGPGVFNASHALTVYLEQASPGLIVLTGIAGAFKSADLDIGDIAIATREQYIHTGIQTDGIKNAPLPFDLIEKNPLSRQGIYPFESDLVDHYHDILYKGLSNGTKIIKGAFITVSSITSSFLQAGILYSAFASPVMEAMEGAACAHIAALYDVPVIEIRSASNFVGERDKSKWDIDFAAKKLGSALTLL